MPSCLRLPGALAVVCLTLSAVTCLAPEGLAALDLNPWRWPAAWGELGREQQRERDLAVQARGDWERRQAKMALVRDVAAGRLSLREAVPRMRDVVRDAPAYEETMARRMPGCTETERLGRDVLDWVALCLENDPGRQAEVTARLERELQAYLTAEPTPQP
jgi:hypothetical protein